MTEQFAVHCMLPAEMVRDVAPPALAEALLYQSRAVAEEDGAQLLGETPTGTMQVPLREIGQDEYGALIYDRCAIQDADVVSYRLLWDAERLKS